MLTRASWILVLAIVLTGIPSFGNNTVTLEPGARVLVKAGEETHVHCSGAGLPRCFIRYNSHQCKSNMWALYQDSSHVDCYGKYEAAKAEALELKKLQLCQ